MMGGMEQDRNQDGGKRHTYWLKGEHVEALGLFQRRHGHGSKGGALRAILEIVAESEKPGGPPPNQSTGEHNVRQS